MKWQDKQGGFTLIEVLLVMAISALLAVTLFSTYSSAHARSQFSDAVERTAAIIEHTQSEVSASFTTGPGTDDTTIFYGKLVIFNSNPGTSGTIKIVTLTAANSDSLGSITPLDDQAVTDTIHWGTVVTDPLTKRVIAWVRNVQTGNLEMYTFGDENAATDPSNYDDNHKSVVATINLISPEGLTATITADPQNLQVSRQYTN